MRKLFRDSPIKTKLTVVIMASCTILLFIVSGVLLLSELYTRQASLKQENAILATSLAEQLRQPLLLEKFNQAEDLLGALSRQKNVHAGYLFDRDGKAVAEYLTSDRTPIVLSALPHDFPDDRLPETGAGLSKFNFPHDYYSSFTPIFFEGAQIGTLYLLSDLEKFYAGVNAVIAGVVSAFIMLVLFSFLLAEFLQKPVSAPLLDLAGVMAQIADRQDYSLRATKQTADEIGLLVDGFNAMLDQIEQHQLALARHQQYLESTVAERTSELRKTVKKLAAARRQADQANQAKSDFLSRMTHELRTPLIGVLGMNELLMRTDLNADQQLLVETVHNSGEELLQLISDVLDFSKIEAGKLTLKPTDVKLFRIVETCVELLAPQAMEKGLQLASEIPLSATWTVSADEMRIRQILMNLIGNAIKFTSSGQVVVRLFCERASSDTGNFAIEVEDSGAGIPPEVSANIFDAFYQVDGSDTREKTGAGLGLAIVRQLVELMHGRIDVSILPQGGSLFRINLTLPLRQANRFDLPADLGKAKALVCTADNLFGRVLVDNLSQLGLSVFYTADGEEALKHIIKAQDSHAPVRLFFTDPECTLDNGRKLVTAVPDAERLPYMKTIVICHDRSRQLELRGGDVRLPLPVDWTRLYQAVTQDWRPVEKNTVRGDSHRVSAVGESTRGGPNIGVLSANVASRELLKLAVKKILGDRCAVLDLSALSDASAMAEPDLILVDFDHLEPAWLENYLGQATGAARVVISRNLSIPLQPELYDLHLQKPLTGSQLDRLGSFIGTMQVHCAAGKGNA